jgi:hypothetical protein
LTRIRVLSLAAVAVLGTGLAAGCGGGGDEDPQQVLDETFNNDQSVNSGVFDLSLSASAEGQEGGSIDASLGGPFEGDENQSGEFPQFDLTASVSGEGGGQSISFEGGVIATTDQAFISYQDNTYEVPQQFFDQIKQASEQAQQQAQAGGQDQDPGMVLDQLGIDPSTWLTNLENEGDEDVEGTETIHIHGDANVPDILEDLQGAAERTGAGATAVPPDQIAQAEEAVDEASIDVYSGKEDRILRRLDLNLGLTPPQEVGATVDSVEIEFSITLSDVNQEQTIEAPSGAQPFSALEQELGLPPGLLEESLSGGALGGGLGAGSLGGGSLGGGSLGGGGGGGAPSGGGSQKYLDCIAAAQTAKEINACASEL